MRKIYSFPPTYEQDSGNSYNSYYHMVIGNQHRNPAAVGMQEHHQLMNKWLFHVLPGLLLVPVCYFLWGNVAAFQSIAAALGWAATGITEKRSEDEKVTGGIVGFLAMIFFMVTSLINPFRRRHEIFGQAVEAYYAHTNYGRDLDDEIGRASRQLKRGYEEKLGIESWSEGDIEAYIRKKLPKVIKYCERHQKRFDRLYDYFHVERGIELVP